MLPELRKVISAFLARVDRPDRGVRWAEYLASRRADTVHVAAELVGVAKVDLAVVDGEAGATDHVANAGFSGLDLAVDIPLSGQQDVAAAGLYCRTHGGLDFAVGVQDVPSGGSRSDCAALQLELAQPSRKERCATRVSCPGNPSVLATVRRVNAVGHVNRTGRDAVLLGLDAQEPSQQIRQSPFGEGCDVFAVDGERPGLGIGHGPGLPPDQGLDHPRIGLKEQQQVDDRRRRLDRSGLVFGEAARSAAEQFAGLDLRETEVLANRPDFAGCERSGVCGHRRHLKGHSFL